jgi:flagellar motor protein MotB
VYSAVAASTLDAITNAETAEDALSAYDSETSRLLSEYKDKLSKKEYKEIESLIKEHRSKYDKSSESDDETVDSDDENIDSDDENVDDDTDSKEQDEQEENDTESTKDTGDSKSSLRTPTAEEQKKIDELKENAKAAKDKEQSMENKLIGAAGIGATGIGGMMLASGMAEQNADADAETAMRAYLETFYCKVGDSKNIKGGTYGAIVPGGNELIDLYSEYVSLANNLKTRKTALDMLPGIESETILDSATSGLYDDVSVGKTGGAYASLARALQNPNGSDAKMWAEQKQKSADSVKTGAITAGIGAAGSLIANLAVNTKSHKENSDEIKQKYANLPKAMEKHQEKLDDMKPVQNCPSGTSGTYPDCTCSDDNKIYNPESNTCTACASDEEIKNNQCVKKSCKFTGYITASCACVANASENQNDECECDEGYYYDEKSQQCVENTNPTQEMEPISKNSIGNDIAFKSGSAEPSDQIKTRIKEIANDLKKSNISADDTCVRIIGHTDRVPWKKAQNGQTILYLWHAQNR